MRSQLSWLFFLFLLPNLLRFLKINLNLLSTECLIILILNRRLRNIWILWARDIRCDQWFEMGQDLVTLKSVRRVKLEGLWVRLGICCWVPPNVFYYLLLLHFLVDFFNAVGYFCIELLHDCIHILLWHVVKGGSLSSLDLLDDLRWSSFLLVQVVTRGWPILNRLEKVVWRNYSRASLLELWLLVLHETVQLWRVSRYILVLVLLGCLFILRMHGIKPCNNTREWPLSAHSSRLWSLPANKKVITDQVVFIINDQWLSLLSALENRSLDFLADFLLSNPLCWIRLLQNRSFFFGFALRVALRPNLHDASLRSWSNCNTLAIVRSILFAEDVLEHRKLIIIHIKQVIFFIIVIIKINDSQVICWALVISLRKHLVFFLGITWVKMAFKYKEITLVMLLRVGPWAIIAMSRIIETLYNLIFEPIKNWSLSSLRLLS